MALTLPLVVGNWYRTRNKKRVQVIYISTTDSNYPVLFRYESDPGREEFRQVSLEGRESQVRENPFDFLHDWVDPVYRWLNIYETGFQSPLYDTALMADMERDVTRTRICRVKIDLASGDVESEPINDE